MNPDIHKSIAVLPFVNMSSGDEDGLFCDGITEEIINALSKIKKLKVTSRTSSFYFKDKKIPLGEIGKTLNVSTLLEGSVRIYGSKLRVTAQLINVEDDTHFWSETWDRNLENVFDIQDEISLLIADKLREQMGHFQIQEHLSEASTHNLPAYQYCLRGRSLLNKWNPEDVNLAISYFEKAISLDPNMIEAHTGLADGYSFLAVAGFAPREEAWSKSIQHLDKAKTIDPHDAPLNYLLANQSFFTEANFEKAMRHAHESIASKPNYSEANQFMAFLFILRGDQEKAKEYLMYAKAIDPLNPETKFYEAYFYYRFKHYGKAKTLLEELLVVNKHNLPAVITLAYLFFKTGKFEKAEATLNSVPTEMIMPDEKLGLSCLSYALSKNFRSLKDPQKKLEDNAAKDTSFQAHAYLYKLYCCLGKHDAAFKVLNKIFQNKSSVLLLALADPLAESIQIHPKFEDYHKRIFVLPDGPYKSVTKTAGLNDDLADAHLTKLKDFIVEESPFLNPTLTLRELASQIEMHPNQLSWLLNEKIGNNFNTFINRLRTEHFKKLAVDPNNSHISIIGLAYESGFNSKTVFNTVFKKETGMTPKQYLKSIS